MKVEGFVYKYDGGFFAEDTTEDDDDYPEAPFSEPSRTVEHALRYSSTYYVKDLFGIVKVGSTFNGVLYETTELAEDARAKYDAEKAAEKAAKKTKKVVPKTKTWRERLNP